MGKNLLIIIHTSIALLSGVSLFSLQGQNCQNNAEYFYINQRYGEALPIYLGLLKPDSSDPYLNLKIGRCYLESRSQKEKAIFFLEKAAVFSSIALEDSIKNDGLLMADKHLGDACFLSHKFDCALSCYETFKKNYSCPAVNTSLLPPVKTRNICDEVNSKIEMSLFGKKITESLACPPAYKSSVNPFFEDTFILPMAGSGPGMMAERKPQSLQFEATVATSTDGQVILIYKDVRGKAELYTFGLSENSWTAEERLDRPVNLSGWETDEYISADGAVMYFTSSREGGLGGKDIYKCEKLPGGEWSKAKNLGDVINSPYDEEAPFIYTDGITLFFSSNRNDTGEFEVFASSLSEGGSWTEPVSAGFPVIRDENTTEEKTGTGGITASVPPPAHEKDKGAGRVQKEDMALMSAPLRIYEEPVFTEKSDSRQNSELTDLAEKNEPPGNYLISFYDQNKTPLIILKGRVSDIYSDSVFRTKISVTENETGKIAGIFIADSSGKYSIILPGGKNLNITFDADGYLFHSENIDLSKDSNFYEKHNVVQLVPPETGSEIVLNNIFFAPDKTDFSFSSFTELSNLLNLLKENPRISVEISYLLQPDKKNAAVNADLAQNRAQAVVDYLSGNGIQKDRLTARGVVKLPKEKTPGCRLRVSGTYFLSGHPE